MSSTAALRLSYCTIGFKKQPQISLREIIGMLVKTGYDGVEIWEPHIHNLSDAEVNALCRHLDAAGITAAMISPYFDFTTSDETAATSVLDGMWLVERAQRLGALGIRVFAGRCGSATATPEQWQRSVRSLQTLADKAGQAPIIWVVEPHAETLADSEEMLLRYLREVNRPSVKAIYQATNLMPDYLGALDKLAPAIAHIHANNILGDANYPPLEGGECDYVQIVARLRRIEFAGFISVEYLGVDPQVAMTREVAYLRRLLQTSDDRQ